MNQIATITPVVMTMTSREMADLTEKRHDSVKRTIDTLAEKGVIALPQIVETSFLGADGRKQAVTEYHVGKRDSYVIVAQLSPEFTARIVDRWQALEEKAATAQPVQTVFINPATKELAHQLEVMSLFGVPLHLAQSEATKEVLLLCGVDYSKALKLAPAQQGMLTHEEMLEPTELGRIVGLSAAHMNQRLEAAGMQTKTVDGWALTGLGAPYATRHHWQSKGGIKSGYNMKWRRAVLKMLDL